MRIHLDTGWVVSIQSTEHHHCAPGASFEVAAWDASGDWHTFDDDRTLGRNMTRRQVAAVVNKLSRRGK